MLKAYRGEEDARGGEWVELEDDQCCGYLEGGEKMRRWEWSEGEFLQEDVGGQKRSHADNDGDKQQVQEFDWERWEWIGLQQEQVDRTRKPGPVVKIKPERVNSILTSKKRKENTWLFHETLQLQSV